MLHITLQHHFFNKCQCVCCASSLRDCVHNFVSMCVCLHRVSLLCAVFVCIFYALLLSLSLSPPHSTGSRDVRSRYVCVCLFLAQFATRTSTTWECLCFDFALSLSLLFLCAHARKHTLTALERTGLRCTLASATHRSHCCRIK